MPKTKTDVKMDKTSSLEGNGKNQKWREYIRRRKIENNGTYIWKDENKRCMEKIKERDGELN